MNGSFEVPVWLAKCMKRKRKSSFIAISGFFRFRWGFLKIVDGFSVPFSYAIEPFAANVACGLSVIVSMVLLTAEEFDKS